MSTAMGVILFLIAAVFALLINNTMTGGKK
jgi:hypothetical protein